ncbi:MAG: hypothetical protein KatS3mg060_1348 [Dehalococcoidia bacterium]|nr:MAG: hypothetical protein KatS3mg060_1348 [Dehalococcoidia bacterium]
MTQRVGHPSRRELLRAGALAGAAAVLGGCFRPSEARIGIAFGTQPLWRVVAARKAEIERVAGAALRFTAYPSETEARAAFQNGSLDILATQPSQLPHLRAAVGPVQLFLAIAWIAESLPIITAAGASITSVSELTGKRLAIPALDDPGVAYWRAFIYGVHRFRIEDRIELVTGLDNPGLAVLNGTVDAAIVNSGLWAAFKPTGRFAIVSDLSAEWARLAPGRPTPIFGGYLARRGWIETNRRLVDALAQATASAFDEYKRDPAAFAATAASYQDDAVAPRAPSEMTAIAGFLGMREATVDRLSVAESDVETYQQIWELMARASYLREAPADPRDLFLLGAGRTGG